MSDTEPINSIGIDLGTKNSCVGVWRFGKVEIIANNHGSRTTPSVVSFGSEERYIGEAAINNQVRNFENTIYDVKRLIGRSYSCEIVQKDMKNWPFNVERGQFGKPMIVITANGEKKLFSPEQVSAMVLSKMKETAEVHLNCKIENAVITVPAHFSNAQRQATVDAAKICGLKVLRILNEPTAAAIAYGSTNKISNKKILLFDFGGGTLDVSIMKIENGIFEMISTAGDTHLGGEDFDIRLVEAMACDIKNKFGRDITSNKKYMTKLKKSCERAKIILSKNSVAHVELEMGDDVFTTAVTRSRFDMLNDELFEKCIKLVNVAIVDACIAKDEIDNVVMVGGSSHIHKIHFLLSDLFGENKIERNINASEAVAIGATIQAAVLSKSGDRADYPEGVLKDIIPLSLGVDLPDGKMHCLVKRNSPYPFTITKKMQTSVPFQEILCLRIFQGEKKLVKDNILLGQFALEGLTRLPAGECKISVTISVDENCILNVSAVETATGKCKSVTIAKNAGNLSESEIQQMILDESAFKSAEEENRKILNAKIQLEDLEFAIRKELSMKASVSQSEREYFIGEIEEEINWLRKVEQPKLKEIEAKIERLKLMAEKIVDRK